MIHVTPLLQLDNARTAALMRQYNHAVAARRRGRLMLFAGLTVCALVAS
jgi:hypothetical protein